MEKPKITYRELYEWLTEARAIPGMRMGQYVSNKLPRQIDAESLFYCEDRDFWTVVVKYLNII